MSFESTSNTSQKIDITPCVQDEFGTLKSAVISAISNPDVYRKAAKNANEPARSLMLSEVSRHPDIRVHAQLRQILQEHNVEIHHPHHPNLPLTEANLSQWIGGDIYCHDFLSVVDRQAISSRVVPFRDQYRMYYDHIVNMIPANQHSHTDERFTWGNGLLVGNQLLVGLEHNDFFSDIVASVSRKVFEEILQTYEERSSGIRAVRSILEVIKSTRSVLILPANVNSDLDISLAPLPKRSQGDRRRAIVREEAFHPASEKALYSIFDELIPYADPWEKMGCNILWLDPETPLLPAEARNTASYLRSLGYNVKVRPLGALLTNDSTGTSSKGEPGGWRCMTGVLERAHDYNFD